jgi:N-acetyl sugar amidotransferase
MDTSDPDIRFDENGICNHCRKMDERKKFYVLPEQTRREQLNKIVEDIKAKGRGKKYDCLIGVSGGVDSTFVAFKVKELGLRALAVHLDNGWDAEIAVANIEKAMKRLKIDLFTHVLDWEEFKNLQIAFLKASTPDLEIPTDHAIYALLRQVAAKENIEYIVDGVNFATEAVMAKAWSQGYYDWRYIKEINKKFGRNKLKGFPHYSLWNLFYFKRIKRQKTVSILNYFDYNKSRAKEILSRELGWGDYGGKHYESTYTQFIQAYILPTKFGFDKRRAHLSTLINSGQISRAEALQEMGKELYPADLLKEHKEYVIKKLGLRNEEFAAILNSPARTYKDYRRNSRYTVETLEDSVSRKIIGILRSLGFKS